MVEITVIFDIYRASGNAVRIISTYVTAIAVKGPKASSGLVRKRSGPTVTPWYCKTTSMIAAVAPPGMPITSNGTNVPDVTPLFADSGAISPSICPVP